MKYLVALLLLVLAPSAWALGCQEHYIGLITVSRHISPSRDYNEEQWGPYWRCGFSQNWSGQVGWYRNSFKRDTFYGLINYVPLRWGSLRLGGSVGAGTGYAEHSDGSPAGGLSLIVGGIAAWEVDRRTTVGVFFNTAVVALILEARWR